MNWSLTRTIARPAVCDIRAVAIWVVLIVAGVGCFASPVWPQNFRETGVKDSLFLGTQADHWLDRDGVLGIDAVAAPDNDRFVKADGKVANYGTRPTLTSALWLRVRIPALAARSLPQWTISLNEPRARQVSLYVKSGDQWRALAWQALRPAAVDQAVMRYPVFVVPGDLISGRVIYLRIESPSSLRGILWLHPEASFFNAYSHEALLFGALFGMLLALFVYIAVFGMIMRDPALISLAVFMLAYVGYAVSDRGFLDTAILPDATLLARMLSFPGTFVIHGARLAFSLYYLRVPQHYPRIALALWGLVGLMALGALRAIWEVAVDEVYWARRVLPYAGILVTAVTAALLLVMLRREWRRVLAFVLCWLPALAAGTIRAVFDAYPGIDAHPLVLNGTYLLIGLSLLMFSIFASLDLQYRERRLRSSVQISEARFRSFADSASDSFWETDADGTVVHRIGPASEALGLRLGVGMLDTLKQGGGQDAIGTALKERHAFRSMVVDIADAAGRTRHIGLSGAPVFHPGGGFIGFRGIATDLTEDIARRNRDLQQQKMAAIGQLAGGIAHEINNLLHPILNLSRRVAAQFASGDEKRKQLDIVVDAGVRASEIVAGILAYVRPDIGDGSRMPFPDAVRRASDAIRPIIGESIRYKVEIDTEDGPFVAAGEVLQVLSNLVANAVYATGGAGAITVSFAVSGDDDKPYRLVVADDGSGMDDVTRERALEPFFTTKEPGRGTGLGLSIVYGLVRNWRGTIEIESRPGYGTHIIIRLPRGEAAS
ncbi:MAG: sensor histidine kinase [Rhizobiales bacterium]|nr:sensor histidine kinase [Hyphomicrobiales bacterium]